ncbi:MAG: hypothetical protein HZB80_07100 [Deltaproteobacteria bacterium]|nr:hypothetical protein [Deltaproteobacteria bacterium]
MEIVMGIVLAVMIIGFVSGGGMMGGMMGGHDKDKQKQEHVIKDNGHKKSDCKAAGDDQKDNAADKDNTNCEEIKK